MSQPLIRTARLVTAYRRYLSDGELLDFVGQVEPYYSPTTLEQLLVRGDVESRRAASLALGTVGGRYAIEPLGRALSDQDRGVRMAADDSFRALLRRDAAPVHRQQLLQIMHLIDGDNFATALPDAIILCDRAPMYADAHYALALCWRGLEEISAARRAYAACVWRCRFHYLAWSGLAQCELENKNQREAKKHAQRAIDINPDLEWARLVVRRLQRSLGQN